MPLTEKGKEIMGAMKQQYGAGKGEEVFYASRNSGKIKGVDAAIGARGEEISEGEGMHKIRDEEYDVGAEAQAHLNNDTPRAGTEGDAPSAPERPDRPMSSPPERAERPVVGTAVPTYSPGFANPTADTAKPIQVGVSNRDMNRINRSRWR